MINNNPMSPEDALAFYSTLVNSKDNLQAEMQEAIDQAIPQEVKDQIEDIKAELQPKIDRLNQEISLYEGRLKEYVIQVGETLKGEYHMVVPAKGRTTWDTKGLDGYSKAHPEILAFKTTHDPSASIRKSGR